MLHATRYRRAQALVVLVLSTLVTACLVFAPMYDRALQQAMVTVRLQAEPAQTSGLSLTSYSAVNQATVRSADQLVQLVPPALAAHYESPIRGRYVVVRELPLADRPDGQLVWRDGFCQHVRIVAGRCPTGAGEVAVSAGQQRSRPAWVPGGRVRLGEYDDAVTQVEQAPRLTVTVVGVYTQPADDPYWFGNRLTGRTGSGDLDALLTPEATFTAGSGGSMELSAPLEEVHNVADLPLRTATTGIDQIIPLGPEVSTFVQVPWAPTARNAAELNASLPVFGSSGLPLIARDMVAGRAQAQVTVPLLVAQLALLLTCVLWLVLVAATDQRRAEVAVARLRGRGSVGARQLLLRETLPPVLLGAPVGVLVAVGLSYLARHVVLPTSPPFEAPPLTYAAFGLALAGMTGLTVLSVRRVSREPVASLVRSVSSRGAGFALGAVEAMLVAAATVAFIALATGSVKGPVGLAAPTLLAVAVGVVGSRIVPPLFGFLGHRLLARGRAPSAAALLQAGRRGTTRWLVPVVTVALCLVVFAADAMTIGARNRTGRADAEVGARTVLVLGSVDAALVASTVTAFDPTGRHVTPVAVVRPPNTGAPTTMGVVPAAFRRIALWPGVDVGTLPWGSLTGPPGRPVEITGSTVSYDLTASPLTTTDVDPDGHAVVLSAEPLSLALQVVRPDGSLDGLPLTPLARAGTTGHQTATVTCREGCRVAGIGLMAPRGSPSVSGNAVLSGFSVDGRPVDLGAGSQWVPVTDPDAADEQDPTQARLASVPGGLDLSFSNGGLSQLFLRHVSIPVQAPALLTATALAGGEGTVASTYPASLVDGESFSLTEAGRVPFVPGGSANVSVVNLANLLARGWQGRGATTMEAYLDTADPAYLASVTRALGDKGIGVTTTSHPAGRQRMYDATAAAWSLQLALVVGLMALLVAAVALVVLVATSWRARSRDYAGLRMAGLTPRGVAAVAVNENVPVIAGSGLAGVLAGLVAAQAAMRLVPLFPSPPPTWPVDLGPAWGSSLSAAAVGVLVLVLVGALASRWVAQRSTLDRLRDTV